MSWYRKQKFTYLLDKKQLLHMVQIYDLKI